MDIDIVIETHSTARTSMSRNECPSSDPPAVNRLLLLGLLEALDPGPRRLRDADRRSKKVAVKSRDAMVDAHCGQIIHDDGPQPENARRFDRFPANKSHLVERVIRMTGRLDFFDRLSHSSTKRE
jgi:hypothetical protein